jgi:hypothetical protein
MKPLVPEPLVFPRGVRFARPDEIPAGVSPEVLADLANARLTTGYLLHSHTEGAFTAFLEANVHADRVWAVFQDLARALLPEVAAPIVGVKDDEPLLGPYTDRDAAIAVFEPYVEALQHDGLLELGAIFQYRGRTEEVFVRAAKYLQIWTNEPRIAMTVLERHGIPRVESLQFLDQYPRVSETSRLPDGSAGWRTVVEGLTAAFETLPKRYPEPGLS